MRQAFLVLLAIALMLNGVLFAATALPGSASLVAVDPKTTPASVRGAGTADTQLGTMDFAVNIVRSSVGGPITGTFTKTVRANGQGFRATELTAMVVFDRNHVLVKGNCVKVPGGEPCTFQADFFDFGTSPGKDSIGISTNDGITVQGLVTTGDIAVVLPLAPGQGGTILGLGGTSVTVQPNSIRYEVLIDIAPVPPSSLQAPAGNLLPVGAFEITFQPTQHNADYPPLASPLQASVPAPPGAAPGSTFIVGQQVLTDFIGNPPGLRPQFMPVGTAIVVGGNLVTQANVFHGILGGGSFALLTPSGSGFATGVVSDATGPQAGVVVSNNTNTLVSITDGAGRYTLYISGGPFTVTAFDPFRGSSGSAAGNIVVNDSTVIANIALSPLAAPPITRDGIRNGGFERGDLSSWALAGAGAVRQQFGPTSTNVTIQPTEGQWMADINTGAGSIGATGSSLKQRFIVPAGVQTLRIDFAFISEEFPEFVGTIFNDAFRATVTTPNGQTTFAQVSVNQSGGFTLIGDCFFPGGDTTCGWTGWRQGSVNLSAFAGTGTPIEVDLIFSANDAGDNIYDTHVLIDNVRFSTVFVDVNVIAGATAGLARAQNDVRLATEILSQAGINVQLRGGAVQAVADPGGLLTDADILWTVVAGRGQLTAEETALMGLSRSATATDVNY